MPCVQLALKATISTTVVAFHTKLPGTRPAKLRSGYANSAIAGPPLTLVLLENPGNGAPSTTSASRFPGTGMVGAEHARLAGTGLTPADEQDTTRCYEGVVDQIGAGALIPQRVYLARTPDGPGRHAGITPGARIRGGRRPRVPGTGGRRAPGARAGGRGRCCG